MPRTDGSRSESATIRASRWYAGPPCATDAEAASASVGSAGLDVSLHAERLIAAAVSATPSVALLQKNCMGPPEEFREKKNARRSGRM
jgi:hypothetical protein